MNYDLIVKTCCKLADFNNQLLGFLHRLDGNKLIRPMEIDATGKDVRAGETLERQLRSVGTATDGFYLGGNAALLHGFQDEVDDVHLWIDLLLHIIVLVADHTLHSTLAVAFVHLFGTTLDEAFAVFKLVAVVVADDVTQTGLFHIRRDAQQVVESLIGLCCLGGLVSRQHSGKLHGQTVGIEHLVFGIAWVYAH